MEQEKGLFDTMLEKEHLEFLKKWFDAYVRLFNSGDAEWQKCIDIKIEHSLKVREACRVIGQSLNLSEGELNLAEAAGLFHDIGRFEQFLTFRTFSDSASVDHAELGVQVLTRDHVLDHENETVKRVLLCAVAYHNKLAVPENESETVRLFSCLVRDADKLDIWRVIGLHYTAEHGTGNGVNLGLPDTPGLSPDVVDGLLKYRQVRMTQLKNVNDFKLLQIGWAFDVNFPKTLELMRKRKCLEPIRNSLPDDPGVDEVFKAVTEFVERRLS